MHKSRISGLVIDCETPGLEQAADFWGKALGCVVRLPQQELALPTYRYLKTDPNEVYMLVQKVDHPSRVHLDIESDNIEAEVARLEALGAKRLHAKQDWVVMEAPTGHRFCVVPPVRANFAEEANVWV